MDTYILGYKDNDALLEFTTKGEADAVCEEWCAVEAESIEAARDKYEQAFGIAEADGFVKRAY